MQKSATTKAIKESRRSFLKKFTYGIGLLGIPIIVPSHALGLNGFTSPSKRITVALIGVGLMGYGHLRRLVGDTNFQVLAVCDVDSSRRQRAKDTVEQHYAAVKETTNWHGCSAYNDYREILARSDIDAVVIVTPDHWHAIQAVHSAKAGKDIYCEKPVSLTIAEGRILSDTVRRYGRVFQTGTQYRSIPVIRQICDFIRNGKLGRVKCVFTILDPIGGWLRSSRFKPYETYVNPNKYGGSYVPMSFPLPSENVPEGLDWQMWVGPAQWHNYNSLYHTNPSPGVVPWSFCDSFGAASITWHLSHSTDVIQYALGYETSGPVEIIHPSDGLFPTMTCKYSNGTLLHFVDHWGIVKDVYKAVPSDARLAGLFGGVFVCEGGWITTMSTGGPIEGAPSSIFEKIGLKTREVNIGSNNHHANWLECIHTRQNPSSHAEIGHRSAAVGHLAMISYTLGRSLKWDPVKEEFIGDAEANRLRSRALREPWRF